MSYQAQDYGSLIGMAGFSETLLNNHFSLYQGYVANSNKLVETLATLLTEGRTATPEYAELKRRMGFEFNGMRLHEYYFGNLGGRAALDHADSLAGKLADNYGSVERWRRTFAPPARCAVSAGSSSTRTTTATASSTNGSTSTRSATSPGARRCW